MGRRILDPSIMAKLAKRLRKPTTTINVMVSKLASKQGVSSEAALVVLAKENGIGTSIYQRKLDPARQSEIRDALQKMLPLIPRNTPSKITKKIRSSPSMQNKSTLKAAIKFLVSDPELLRRCQDLLMAPSNYDRAINQATLILEDRIRKKAAPPRKLVGENLVGFAFNEDISKSVLQIESTDADDQRGFTQILRGIVPAFRNKTHHHIVESLSREEATRVVGFIDVLLRIVDKSTAKPPGAKEAV